MDAADLMVKMKEESITSTKSPLGLEASGDNWKTVLPNLKSLKTLPVARAGRIALPPGDASTDDAKPVKDG